MSLKRILPVHCISLGLGIVLLAPPLTAQEWYGHTGWSGDAALGATLNTGNTESENLNTRARLRHQTDRWRHTLQLEAHTGSEEDETTEERYLGSFQSDRRLSELAYLFAALRAEKDRFSGYDYQRALSAGYGRQVLDTPRLKMSLEGGAGLRQDKLEDLPAEEEMILRGAGTLAFEISETAHFTEDLLMQSGEDNTEIESVSALRLRINDRLSTRLSFSVRHNTEVPADREHTDTITAVNLVYDLWE
ncbi:MAG: YdiY family protein [Ectothiorhodospira sp.]